MSRSGDNELCSCSRAMNLWQKNQVSLGWVFLPYAFSLALTDAVCYFGTTGSYFQTNILNYQSLVILSLCNFRCSTVEGRLRLNQASRIKCLLNIFATFILSDCNDSSLRFKFVR